MRTSKQISKTQNGSFFQIRCSISGMGTISTQGGWRRYQLVSIVLNCYVIVGRSTFSCQQLTWLYSLFLRVYPNDERQYVRVQCRLVSVESEDEGAMLSALSRTNRCVRALMFNVIFFNMQSKTNALL